MITVDYRDRRPLYQQLIDNIEALIAGGLLEPDQQLPSVRQLAVELAINPNTIQRAYAELENRGAVYTVPGRGSFVCSSTKELTKIKHDELWQRLDSLINDADEMGITEPEFVQKVHDRWTMLPEKRGAKA